MARGVRVVTKYLLYFFFYFFSATAVRSVSLAAAAGGGRVRAFSPLVEAKLGCFAELAPTLPESCVGDSGKGIGFCFVRWMMWRGQAAKGHCFVSHGLSRKQKQEQRTTNVSRMS
ncbi:unnamed protein product, partial [Hapterophycus canaliculatus]